MNTLADQWFDTLLYVSLGFFALSVIMQLLYAISLMGQKDRSAKYKYAIEHEVSRLSSASNVFSIGVAILAFNLIGSWLGLVQPYQYVFVGFFAFMIAFAFGYGFWAYLKYYYPFTLEKRLKKIRFKPMKSPKSGNQLRLLNELEEDEYLTPDMIDMEEALEADFDVWFDDQTKDTIIMKYDIHEHALVCPNCNFRTFKEHKEEIIKEATHTEPGAMEREYRCSYCGYHEVKEVRIPTWAEKHEIEQVDK